MVPKTKYFSGDERKHSEHVMINVVRQKISEILNFQLPITFLLIMIEEKFKQIWNIWILSFPMIYNTCIFDEFEILVNIPTEGHDLTYAPLRYSEVMNDCIGNHGSDGALKILITCCDTLK